MDAPPKHLRVLHRVLVFALIAAMSVTAAMTGLTLAMPDLVEFAPLIIAVPGLFAAGFLLWLTYVSVALRDRRPVQRIRFAVGSMATAMAVICVFGSILAKSYMQMYRTDAMLGQIGATAFAAAVGIAYSMTLAQVRGRSRLLTVIATLTLIAAWIFVGTVAIIAIGFEAFDSMNNFGVFFLLASIAGIALLATVVGTIIVPVVVVSKALKERQETESIDPRLQVMLGCPKCGERQTLRPGFAKCTACRAGLFIEIEEPRCECGYLLYQLTGESCPECGRPISAIEGS